MIAAADVQEDVTGNDECDESSVLARLSECVLKIHVELMWKGLEGTATMDKIWNVRSRLLLLFNICLRPGVQLWVSLPGEAESVPQFKE